MKEQANLPLISIIVPVCNGSAYIDGLLFGLRDQLSCETELVFVDDGSRDDSYEKLLAWQKNAEFPMMVYHRENRGVSAARNFGMKMAKGEYLTFVDVDDAVADDYIAVLSGCARRGVDVLVFDSRRVKEGAEMTVPSSAVPAPVVRTKEEMLTEFLHDPARFGVYNLLMRKACLTEHAIRFPEGYTYYEDYDFLLQLFARSERILRMEQVLYYYILREGSAMGRFNADRINCLELMKQRGSWLQEHAPEFAPAFRKWGVARLYWSVLWQAALALESWGEFREFARVTFAKEHLTKLKGYPDLLLQLSTAVFLCCKPAFYLAVRLVGRRKSKIYPASLQEILPLLREDIHFY